MSDVVNSLLEQGLIKESQVQEMEEFYTMVKESGFISDMVSKLKNSNVMTQLGSTWRKYKAPLLLTAGTGAVVGGIDLAGKSLSSKLDKKEYQKKINSSLTAVVERHPNIPTPQIIGAFNQVKEVAPAVATSKTLMTVLTPEVVKNGLTENRIMNLVNLEKNFNVGKANQRAALPIHSGSKVIRTFAPTLQKSVGDMGKYMADDMIEQRNNQLGREAQLAKQRLAQARNSSGAAGGAPSMDATQQLIYAFLAAKEAGVKIPRELKNKDPLNPNDALFIRNFITNNKAFGAKMMDTITFKYPEMEWLEVGRKKYEQSKGKGFTKKASIVGEALADEFILKEAGAKGTFSLAKALTGLALAGSVGAGFGIVEEAAHIAAGKKQQKRLHSSWEETKKILRKLPDNVGPIVNKDEQEKAKQAFTVMTHVAPGLAENPVIAASFVHTLVNQDNKIDPNMLKTITDAQKNYDLSHAYGSPFGQDPFFAGTGKGFNMSGGSEIVKHIAKGMTEGDS